MPAMNIAVLIKQVPDTWSERVLKDSDWTLDRDAADAVIDEIDSRGVEAALQLVEQHGGEVTVVTMGPERSTETLRKALAMGADKPCTSATTGWPVRMRCRPRPRWPPRSAPCRST